MMYARVIAASVGPHGIPLYTMELHYQRFIHAEFMTHRMFSRNAGSSRAKPVKKILEQVINDPAMPIHWGKNQPGMQAREEHDAMVTLRLTETTAIDYTIEEAWRAAGINAARMAQAMDDAGYHKQIVNRILEPWQYIDVVVSSTEWENFFLLRDHPDAQPEIQALAREMKAAMDNFPVTEMKEYDWHLPYVLERERNTLDVDTLCKISAARCARVSYKTFEGTNPKVDEDLKLYYRLAGAEPAHLSPLEHVAQAVHGPDRYGNFRGWKQLRQYHEAGDFK